MEALAALAEAGMQHGLRNPIHPVFQKMQWVTEEQMPKQRGAIPILGDHEGFWLVCFQMLLSSA